MGLPKATATPVPADAVRISRVLEALMRYLVKNRETTLPTAVA